MITDTNETLVYEGVLIAGFGGQGIILAGKLLSQAAMNTEHQVTYMPSYGAEVRGGSANCMVVISNEPIASPVFSHPDSAILLNKVSCRKFLPSVKPGGILIINTSRVEEYEKRTDIDLIPMPVDDIAIEVGNIKCANMVAVGAYLQRRNIITAEQAVDCLEDVLAERYHKLIPMNSKAIRRGAEFVKDIPAPVS